jgi:ankyrin repeat protein
MELLIEQGADLNARDIYNRSIVHWAAYTGKTLVYFLMLYLYEYQ